MSVKAIKQGANDFIEKPWNNNRVLSLVETQLSLAKEKRSNRQLTELAKAESSSSGIIADSPNMKPVMQLIERTAASDANILLTGESGVGKSLFAGLIHTMSSRNNAPLVKVNMGALSDSLFESELFGHTKGAFTDAKGNRMGRFEMADNGTLFLDEIANIPFVLQGKLLRVLESGEFEPVGSSKTKSSDVRIISASNVRFEDEISAGRFRRDLLYRLNTITIEIPPLRSRVEDILPIAKAILAPLKVKYRRLELDFSVEAITVLKRHAWPGNVRELSHSMERAVLMAASDKITPYDLGLVNNLPDSDLYNLTLEEAERMLIRRAIEQSEGDTLVAAKKLGISRSALYRRLEKYGETIEPEINR